MKVKVRFNSQGQLKVRMMQNVRTRLRTHVDKHGTVDAAQHNHACVITSGPDDLDLVDTTTGCVIYSTPWTPRALERLAAYARAHHVWLVPDAPRAVYFLSDGVRHAEITQTCAIIDAALAREALEECKHQYEEQPGEPPIDVCTSCGDVRE